MRILHCCLVNFYIDGYGYQENILPKMHKLQGHDVKIVASTETYLDNKKLGYIQAQTYTNENGISVTRLPYIKYLPFIFVKKLRIYKGLKQEIINFKPDIIFLHDTQFISIRTISKYAADNAGVRIYADGHTDFINSARNWVSKNILHKIIYRWCAQRIEPYVQKFYGTLPARVNFIHEIYRIPKSKIELLEFGADDTSFNLDTRENTRKNKRKELGVENHFVVITGGKIDYRKNIHLLINVIKNISDRQIKLIVFGTPDDKMNYLIRDMKEANNVIYLGWQNTTEIYNLLFAADLGFFPGTHSILWEQACGIGLPCVFKKWDDMQHVQLGGNCIFIEEASDVTIRNMIMYLYENKEEYNNMKTIAEQKGIPHFSYYEIAKRAIEIK